MSAQGSPPPPPLPPIGVRVSCDADPESSIRGARTHNEGAHSPVVERARPSDHNTSHTDIAMDADRGKEQVGPSRRRGRRDRRTLDSNAPSCIVSCVTSLEACADNLAECTDNLEKSQLERAKRRGADGEASDLDAVTPDPAWKQRGMIPVVSVILAWVYLVYVWRLCAPAIREQTAPDSHPVRLASRAAGIGLLIGFNVVWLLTIWSYVKVILTPAGFVNDYVQTQSEPPPPLQQGWMATGEGGPYLGPPEHDDGGHAHRRSGESVHDKEAQPNVKMPRTLQGDVEANAMRGQTSGPDTSAPPQPSVPALDTRRLPTDDPPPVDPSLPAILGPVGADIAVRLNDSEHEVSGLRNDAETQQRGQTPSQGPSSFSRDTAVGDPTLPSSSSSSAPPWGAKIPKPLRQPPSPDYAPLAPCNRFCHRCHLVKSHRAHHCRRCGRCVLKMDHHCPWVGGCVGARNHKFFYHFVFWVTVLEAYVVVSTAALFARGAQSRAGYAQWTLDGFVISLFPICLIFFLFTFSLLVTHSWLIASNQSTIEHLGFGRVSRREDLLLSSYFSKRGEGGPGLHVKQRRQIRKGWDREWGKLRWEINLWKVEVPLDAADSTPRYRKLSSWSSRVENWRQTMGPRWWMWLFPLGRPLSDGLDYPVNPRHGPNGEWRRRSEWPEDLQ
ncbi:unnamed protein product [Parajaminaea phylloscopi]